MTTSKLIQAAALVRVALAESQTGNYALASALYDEALRLQDEHEREEE
jgi:hypothetical protein